jgi:hypothetical protein
VCAEAALATNAGVAAAAFEAASQEFLNAYMINMSPAPAGAGWAEWQALLICGVREAWLASGDLQPVRDYQGLGRQAEQAGRLSWRSPRWRA